MKSTVSKIVQINEIIKNLDPSLQEKASELLLQEAFGSQFMDSGAVKLGTVVDLWARMFQSV